MQRRTSISSAPCSTALCRSRACSFLPFRSLRDATASHHLRTICLCHRRQRASGTALGVEVDRVKIAVYAISGFLASLAGVLYTAQYRQGKPDAGVGMELDAIAAVVIGGTSLMGGKGSIAGTFVGRAHLWVSEQHSPAQQHRQQHATGSERRHHPCRRTGAGTISRRSPRPQVPFQLAFRSLHSRTSPP